jgi:hypothetical protein
MSTTHIFSGGPLRRLLIFIVAPPITTFFLPLLVLQPLTQQIKKQLVASLF